jgi:6-pyruvoyl-tetrahydropterin synthase
VPFTVTVRDHMMIAHSFAGELFGPAQRLHGATFVVDATFGADDLDENGVVLDIGWASDALREITGALTHRNLDEDPAFAGLNTTTERLCQVVADRLAERLLGLDPDARPTVTSIAVTLHESHIAWAGYSRAL